MARPLATTSCLPEPATLRCLAAAMAISCSLQEPPARNCTLAPATRHSMACSPPAPNVLASTGNTTIVGGGGPDRFVFTNGQAGGTDLIQNFTSGQDTIDLQGYGKNEIRNALKGQTVSGDSVTITLSDHTTITFAGVTSLTASDFIATGGAAAAWGTTIAIKTAAMAMTMAMGMATAGWVRRSRRRHAPHPRHARAFRPLTSDAVSTGRHCRPVHHNGSLAPGEAWNCLFSPEGVMPRWSQVHARDKGAQCLTLVAVQPKLLRQIWWCIIPYYGRSQRVPRFPGQSGR